MWVHTSLCVPVGMWAMFGVCVTLPMWGGCLNQLRLLRSQTPQNDLHINYTLGGDMRLGPVTATAASNQSDLNEARGHFFEGCER